MRTAPVPLYLLARRGARRRGSPWSPPARAPTSCSGAMTCSRRWRCASSTPRDPERAEELLDQLYSYLGPAAARRGPAWRRFLLETGADDELLGSHLTRVAATAASQGALPVRGRRADRRRRLARPAARGSFPPAFAGWSKLERAAWLEVTTLLEPYLLAAQGDRVAMAHGVEGRYPFLDHRVFALRRRGSRPSASSTACARRSPCASSPSGLLPATIAEPRQAALPGARRSTPFFAEDAPAWVDEALSARRRSARSGSGTRSGSRAWCDAAAPAARPGCARGWPWSGCSRPSSGIGRSSASALADYRSRDDRAAGENRPHQSARPTTSEGGLHDRRR